MASNDRWTRDQLLVAFKLYCEIPFGKFHSKNPEIIKISKWLGRTPSALSMKLCNIASLDPVLTQSGRKGLDRASQKDKDMWSEMQSDWDLFSKDINSSFEKYRSVNERSVSLEEQNTTSGVFYASEKKVLATTRIKQDFFRKTVLSSYNFKCCISGLTLPKLLIASHIVPWSIDKDNRLNPRNGLCLSAIHDKAFDNGILTLNDDFTIKISEACRSNDSFFNSSILAYEGKSILLPDKFQPDLGFLEYHRNKIFLS